MVRELFATKMDKNKEHPLHDWVRLKNKLVEIRALASAKPRSAMVRIRELSCWLCKSKVRQHLAGSLSVILEALHPVVEQFHGSDEGGASAGAEHCN